MQLYIPKSIFNLIGLFCMVIIILGSCQSHEYFQIRWLTLEFLQCFATLESTNPAMSQCNLRREQNSEVTFGMRIWIKGHIKFHFPLKTFLCNQTNVVTPPMEQSFHHKHLGYKRDLYGWFCLPKTNYIGTNSGLHILVQDFFF